MGSDSRIPAEVESVLERCLEWCQTGCHRKVLTEMERLLPKVEDDPHLCATLLIWKAQALLSMGCADRAQQAAARSWELESSPHACHLLANAHNTLGDTEQAEHLLMVGRELFPDAIHLPLQLVMMLADQGRLPEALADLERIESEMEVAPELQAFLLGMQANLLATMGRWREARGLLLGGLERHPDSALLHEARDTIDRAWGRNRAEQRLASTWRRGLQRLDGVSAEVDEAIVHFAAVLEHSQLQTLAARRLWRAFSAAQPVRLLAPDPWAVAVLVAAQEVDGMRPSVTTMARATATSASTVRSCLGRLRSFLEGFDAMFRSRAFGATSNPMLDSTPGPDPPDSAAGTVVRFPGSGKGHS